MWCAAETSHMQAIMKSAKDTTAPNTTANTSKIATSLCGKTRNYNVIVARARALWLFVGQEGA